MNSGQTGDFDGFLTIGKVRMKKKEKRTTWKSNLELVIC